MTYRCLELLDLPASEEAMVDDDDDEEDDEEEDRVRARPSYLLDIGAGSGLSGEILTEEGHQWVGMDVSGGMLGQSLASLRPYNPKTDVLLPYRGRTRARSRRRPHARRYRAGNPLQTGCLRRRNLVSRFLSLFEGPDEREALSRGGHLCASSGD